MAYQNLFEQLKETCNFIALEDDMKQIINAVKKDMEEDNIYKCSACGIKIEHKGECDVCYCKGIESYDI